MRLYVNCLAVLLAILLRGNANAQQQGQPLIDSLLKELPKQKEDTNKVKLLDVLSNSYKGVDFGEMLKYARQQLDLSRNLKFQVGIGYAYNHIAIAYENFGNYPEGLKNYFAALQVFENIGDKRGISMVYKYIGGVYESQANYQDALKNYSASKKIAEEIGSKTDIADYYLCSGNINFALSKFQNALTDYNAAKRIAQEIGEQSLVCMCLSNIANINKTTDNYYDALNNYFAALKIAEETGSEEMTGMINICVGDLYLTMKDNNKAEKYTAEGLRITEKLGVLEGIQGANEKLSEICARTGREKKALEYYKTAILIKDSIYNKENAKKLVQSQMQYEFDKKEALAKAEQDKKDAVAGKELQKQKLARNGFMGGFAVVLLFAGVFFNQRNKIKDGKRKSDELLLNILPSEVAEELKAKGSADAKMIDEVTVLFTDFKGFTSLSEKLTPTALVAEINECFSAFDRIMEKYGVEKIKTIGDSYMAAGGLPTANKTHPDDVVKAALEIQKYMIAHKAKKEAAGELFFEIRIGVHTGPVVAGIVGVKKFQYDIWGDTVNTASRMESSGAVGKVNISGATYELVKDKFICEYRGEIAAKNKGMMGMYFVKPLSPKGEPSI